MTKQIPLSQGKVAIVDDELYDYLAQWKWSVTLNRNRYYARRTDWKTKKKIYMHRLIANVPSGLMVDHINDDSLDNRRENLRVCTNAQNLVNTGKPKSNTSGFKGVSWSKFAKKYQAYISKNGKRFHLGYFDDNTTAALAYDYAAIELHGPFAKTNII
jgi:hypothetical protein